MSLDPAQRAGLERARAIALGRQHFDIHDGSVEALPFGVVVSRASGPEPAPTVCIVSSSADLAMLGGVLAWLNKRDIAPTTTHLVVEHHAGIHARRVAVLGVAVTVWQLDGAAVRHAVVAAIEPPCPTTPDIGALVAMIERSGAEVVIEDGIVRAEVAGLEVGRIVEAATGAVLEVGVGRFDREASVLLHAREATEPALVDVVARVRPHRLVGAHGHAVNRIGRERWLRHLVHHDPRRFGLNRPILVDPVPPRSSLLDSGPASLLAEVDGHRWLVACTVGVDLGLVPELADLVAVHEPVSVIIFLPARDRFAYLEPLLAWLPVPAEARPIEVPWVD